MQYGVPQNPLFLPEIPDPQVRQSNLQAVLKWQRNERRSALRWPTAITAAVLKPYWAFAFFLGPTMLFGLIVSWEKGGRRLRRITLALAAILVIFSLTYWFILPHYLAALTPLAAVLTGDSLRRFSRSLAQRWKGRWRSPWVAALGIGLLSLADAPVVAFDVRDPINQDAYRLRREVTARLAAMPGRKLALVEYSAGHWHAEEWVYNAADVDDSEIVWATLPDKSRIGPLLQYFYNRTVWVIRADQRPVEMRLLSSSASPANQPATMLVK